MFVPGLYAAPSDAQVDAVVRENPLALLVTNGPEVPFATHLPVVTAPGTEGDPLVGRTLLGHLNRANPHWPALRDTARGKLVFSGPGTYVSPTTYETNPAAPTWDFVTAHVYGAIRPIPAGEPTLAVVRRTAAILEGCFGTGWDQESSVDYFRSIVGGVGAFEFVVDETEAMFKLSQEKDLPTRQRLIDTFSACPAGSGAHRVGALMRDLGLGRD
jgi:transcriptional regulator